MLLFSWFQAFAVFCILYAFFWVIIRRLEFICRLFGTLCLFHLHRQVDVSRQSVSVVCVVIIIIITASNDTRKRCAYLHTSVQFSAKRWLCNLVFGAHNAGRRKLPRGPSLKELASLHPFLPSRLITGVWLTKMKHQDFWLAKTRGTGLDSTLLVSTHCRGSRLGLTWCSAKTKACELQLRKHSSNLIFFICKIIIHVPSSKTSHHVYSNH